MSDQDRTPPPGFHPPTHGNWAQWAAVILALFLGISNIALTLYFHSAATATQTSDEHSNALITAKVSPAIQAIGDNVDKKLAPISGQLSDLTTRVAKLEGRFEQLDADQKRLTKLQLDKLSAQITAAQQRRTTIDSETISRLSENVLVFANYNESSISSAAWRIETQLANYRTTLNQAAADPIIKAAKATGPKPYLHVTIEARALPTEGGTFLGFSYDDLKSVPFSETARYEKLNAPNESQQPGPEFLVLEARNMEIILDGFHLRNIVIHDVQVRYDGGPLAMENVYFVNCRFVITQKPVVEGFAQNVITSVPVTFKAPQSG